MPTARGWTVAAASLACWAAGWLLGRPELAVVGLGGGFAMVAAALSIARPAPVEVSRDLAPERVTRGDPAIAVLTCIRSGRPGWARIRAVDRFRAGAGGVGGSAARSVGGPVSGSAGGSVGGSGGGPVEGTAESMVEADVELPHAGSGESSTTTYAVPTTRRGTVVVGPLRLVRTDPWGLLRRTRSEGDSRTLRVLPRTVALSATPSGRLRNPDGPGADRAAGSTVFHALRQYEFGDDLRQIHWRTSARTGNLMVRSLVDTSLPWTVVVLDTRANAYTDPDDFELGVDVAASLSLAAARPGFPILLSCGDRPLLSGSLAPAAVLDELSTIIMTAESPHPDRDLFAGIRSWRGRGALIFVTGAGGATEPTAAEGIHERFDTATVVRVGSTTGTPASALPFPVIDVRDLAGFAAAWQRGASR